MNRALVAAFASVLLSPAFAQTQYPVSAPPPQASIEAAKAVGPSPTGSNADAPFYRDALAGGVREMALSRLAMSQSGSVEVNRLASMIVEDHTNLDRELSASGKTNEPQPSAADGKSVADLTKMSGALFDRTYLATMERDHEAAIALFEDASLKAQDASTRELATTALPQLRKHLLAVQALQKKLQGS